MVDFYTKVPKIEDHLYPSPKRNIYRDSLEEYTMDL